MSGWNKITAKLPRPSESPILAALLAGWLACLIYVFLEWLFFVTKPSLLNTFSATEKAAALFSGSLLIFTALLPLILILVLADRILQALGGKRRFHFSLLIPALLASASIFLLIENFTYTVLGFNTSSFTGIGRIVYGLAFSWLLISVFLRLQRMQATQTFNAASLSLLSGAALLIALILSLLIQGESEGLALEQPTSAKGERPNIIILSSDGINSSNMSLYGYERDTTPFLDSVQDEYLVFDNHFTNAANTTGSVISLLTGKLPTSTRVIYPPDTLKGRDSYQHLPGILKKLGYTNGDISAPYYIDPRDLNLLEGFDYIRGENIGDGGFSAAFFKQASQYLPSVSLFIQRSYNRISDRLKHIYGLHTMENPYQQVTEPSPQTRYNDFNRMQHAREFITRTKAPFFLHIHLLGTHGPRFSSRDPLFSKDKDQSSGFMTDFYDDAIRDFDTHVKDFTAFLKQQGYYDNSILIINTDHGKAWSTRSNLPLLIKFPGSSPRGRTQGINQRVDIAPTILETLNLTPPSWMDGHSLLNLPRNEERYIFATVNAPNQAKANGFFEVASPSPPFYTLGKISLIHCQQAFVANLQSGQFIASDNPAFEKPCPDNELFSKDQGAKIITQHLKDQAYQVDELDLMNQSSQFANALSQEPLVLKNNQFFIPAVKTNGLFYAAIMEQTDNDPDVFRVISLERLIEDRDDAVSMENNSFELENVRWEQGELRNLRLKMVDSQELLFNIEVVTQ